MKSERQLEYTLVWETRCMTATPRVDRRGASATLSRMLKYSEVKEETASCSAAALVESQLFFKKTGKVTTRLTAQEILEVQIELIPAGSSI